MGRLVRPKGKANRENKWIIPKVEVKPKYDFGMVTDNRRAALKKAKELKKADNTERNRKMDAFRKQMGWA